VLRADYGQQMIRGAHVVLYSTNADADRAFFRDVLAYPSVDAGHGWLIFALPPAELGIHPTEDAGNHELYLMCADIEKTVAELQAKGVEFPKPITDAGFGLMASFKIPGGAELSIYQPKHPTAIQQRG
jgi:predicted enzyme related to lactoylglutathione lyase